MTFRDALEMEQAMERCCLRITGSPGCSKRGCTCGNAPYAILWLVTPREDTHGVAIQTVEKMDEFIEKLQTLRRQLWGDKQ